MSKMLNQLATKTLDAIARGTYQGTSPRHDGGGLFITTNKVGGYWSYRYMVKGKLREIGIGSLCQWPAAEARSKAQQLRDLRRAGVDPLAQAQAQAVELAKVEIEQSAKLITFDIAAGQFFDQQDKVRDKNGNPVHPQTMANYKRWRAAVQLTLGQLVVRDIKPSQVAAVLVPIYQAGKYESGKRMRQWVERVIHLGLGDDDNVSNPADAGRLDKYIGSFKKGETRHREALDWQAVPELIARLLAWDNGKSPRAHALVMVILSGLRAVEVCRTTFGEFQADGCWIKPDSHMKMRRTHYVPTSSAINAIVERMAELNPDHSDDDLVFPGLKAGEMIDEDGMLKLLREVLPGSTATVAGFRSTIQEWGNTSVDGREHRYSSKVMKRVIAHAKNSEDGATFARYHRDNYYAARIGVMQTWADHCFSKVQVPASTRPMPQRPQLQIAA